MAVTADLTAGFERPTRDQWLELTARSLKGAPFDSLVSRTADGLEIQPLYTADGAAAPLELRLAEPIAESAWDVRAAVRQGDAAKTNTAALDELANGANSLLLDITTGAVGSAAEMARALEGVVLEVAPVALDAGFRGVQAASWLAEAAKGSPGALLAFHLDPIGALAESGSSPGPIEAHIQHAAELAARFAPIYPKATAFLASGRVVHEAGGAVALELSFMAASALAYVKAMVAAGLDMEQAFASIVLSCAVDGDYFVSIAKLRAARAIWNRLSSACGVATPARIEARSSRRMLAGLDAWTNLLRLTAADFGAACGGANAVVLDAFTQPLGAPSDLARRQARNIQLVLREESHLGKVADPAAGSWYIEHLSRELAELAWAYFQFQQGYPGADGSKIDGGIIEALTSDYLFFHVQSERWAAMAASEQVNPGQVGVSRFPDLAGRKPEAEPKSVVASANDSARLPGPDTVCRPLEPFRMSEPFEVARARAAALPAPAAASLVIIGKPGDSAERAATARNLLASGGIRLASGGEDEARIVVLAGANEALAAEGVAAVRRLKTTGALVLVAAPAEGHELLVQAGADGFVHAGVDVIALANDLLDYLEGRPR